MQVLARSAVMFASLLAVHISASAHAESFASDPAPKPPAKALVGAEEGVTLPFTLGARHDTQKAIVSFISGYDFAHDSPSLELVSELQVWGPFYLRGGAVYSDNGDVLRPSFGVVWQAAQRQKAGVDLAVSVAYRPEGFTEPEGEIETTVAVGRRFGLVNAVLNAAYGQDPEGNEQDAEGRLAIFGRVAGPLIVGFDSKVRVGISTPATGPDAGRKYDLLAGPTATWAFQSWALTGQVGVSVLGLDTTTKTGASALMGVSLAL